MTRICARSGCDKPVIGRKYNAIYHDDACKVAACKDRRRVAASAAASVAEQPLPGLHPTTARVVYALIRAGARGCSTAELAQATIGGTRFGARIKEARDIGYAIRQEAERGGSYQHRYWLTGTPARRRLEVVA